MSFTQMLRLSSLFLMVSTAIVSAELDVNGQNVCAQTKYVAKPIRVRQSYRRPVQELDLSRCEHEQLSPCNLTRTSYQTVYRMTVKMRVSKQNVSSCCPGWMKRSYQDTDCRESQCSQTCENGGRCVGRQTCLCRPGYVGRLCQIDIDECSGQHNCQQKCVNLKGSYTCGCADGFKLDEDGKSCKLCLQCTPEFRELQAKVTIIPAQRLAEEEERMQNMQADVMEEMKRQAETFNKLEAQYDNIVDLQKQLIVLPAISARLDELAGLQPQLKELKELEPRILSLEERVEEGMAALKASHRDTSEDMDAAMKQWQANSLAMSNQQAKAIDRLQDQLDKIVATVDSLEQEKVELKNSLSSALDHYEEAMTQFKIEPPTTWATTRTPMNSYGAGGNAGDDHMSLDRLASLSQQISILEERMAECMCGQDYNFR